MKKFLFHSLLFLAPFAVLLGIPFFILEKSGEMMGKSEIIDLQKKSGKLVLFGQVYTDSRRDRTYKIDSAVARKPEVLLMGTSRMLGYRSDFFKNPEIFYNAGRSIARMEDLNIFLNSIPIGQEPKIIIVELDQIFFFEKSHSDLDFDAEEHQLSLFFKHTWRLVYSDYFNKKFTLAQIQNPPRDLHAVGLNAIVHRKGFRNDGSYYYGDVIGNSAAESEAVALKKRGVDALTPESCVSDYYGKTILPEGIIELKKFLEIARTRGIAVIGFVSPYAPSIYGKIQSFGSEDACFRSMRELDRTTAEIFRGNGAQFIDVTDLTAFGGSDAELFDSGHYSEKLSLRLLLAMAEKNESLKRFVDMPFLRKHLKNSTDNFTIFPQL